jgi:hypothetical protein
MKSFDQRYLFLVERRIFRDSGDNAWRMPFLQLESDIVDRQFVARNRKTVFRIEVCEVSELVSELVSQPRVGKDIAVTVAFVALHERRDK